MCQSYVCRFSFEKGYKHGTRGENGRKSKYLLGQTFDVIRVPSREGLFLVGLCQSEMSRNLLRVTLSSKLKRFRLVT